MVKIGLKMAKNSVFHNWLIINALQNVDNFFKNIYQSVWKYQHLFVPLSYKNLINN